MPIRPQSHTVLTGGDDFEVIATVPPRALAAFRAMARRAGVATREIGVVTAERGARFIDPDRPRAPLPARVFQPFLSGLPAL